MPKKKIEKPKREVTRRQMSHWQRESRLQRFTMIGGIIVVLAILIVVGTGVYMNKYKPFREVVIKVDNTEYNMDYYINTLAYYGRTFNSSGLSQYMTFDQYLSNIADSVAQQIGKNQIYIQEAAKLSVTVSEAEVQQYIKDNKLSSDQTRIDAVRALLMQKKLQDYFDKNPDNGVPQSAEQRAVLAMFLESQSQVDAVKTELKDPNNTKSFSDLAAELSLESKSKANKGDFGWVPQGILASTLGNTSDTVLNDTVFGKDITKDNLPALTQAEDKDQTKNIGYWLLEVTGTRTNPTPTASATPSPSPNASPVPTPTPNNTQVHLLAMLLGSKEQADQIKAKLAAGGEGNDFATLAKANSQYQNAATDGGDVGWKSKGEMSAAVDKVIFPDDPTQSIENNQVSDPIPDTTQTTKGGFWLVQVTGIETQTISSDNRTTLINNKVSDWEGKVWTDNKDKVTIQPTDAQKQFAIAQAQLR